MKTYFHLLFGVLMLFTSLDKGLAQTTLFVPASSPSVGKSPYRVCAADLNGDGTEDLISANYADNSLTLLTNNSHGSFVVASSLVVGNGPNSVCAADVNGDGKMDLICANANDNTLTVLTNNGVGGFVIASSPAVGIFPNSVCAADVNGDGKPDLICVNNNDDKMLTVLTNNGIGGFAIASTPLVGTQPQCVCAADVNGDGKMDLICANYGDGTLTVLTNDGTGGFVTASSPEAKGTAFVVAADVNGDGKIDLISANFGVNGVNTGPGTLTILTNDGSGNFIFASSPGVGIHPVSICAADVNGDGKIDLICANYGNYGDSEDSTLSVLTNDGSGGFVLACLPTVGSHPVSVCAANVNGDDKVDLICANYGDDTLTVLTNEVVTSPLLTITYSSNKAIISWPPSVTGWTLQTNNNLTPANWSNYLGTINNNSVTNSLPKGTMFFRLEHF